jgi:hypothetical protein
MVAGSFMWEYWHRFALFIATYEKNLPKKVAMRLAALMGCPQLKADVLFIALYHSSFWAPHQSWLQDHDEVTKDFGLRSHRVLVHYYLMLEDLAALQDDGWCEHADFVPLKTLYESMGDADKKALKRKVNGFLEDAEIKYREHWDLWRKGRVLPYALGEEPAVAHALARRLCHLPDVFPAGTRIELHHHNNREVDLLTLLDFMCEFNDSSLGASNTTGVTSSILLSSEHPYQASLLQYANCTAIVEDSGAYAPPAITKDSGAMFKFLWYLVYPHPHTTHRMEAAVRKVDIIMHHKHMLSPERESAILRVAEETVFCQREEWRRRQDLCNAPRHANGASANKKAKRAEEKGGEEIKQTRTRIRSCRGMNQYMVEYVLQTLPDESERKQAHDHVQKHGVGTKMAIKTTDDARVEELRKAITARGEGNKIIEQPAAIEAEATPAVLGRMPISEMPRRFAERELCARKWWLLHADYGVKGMRKLLNLIAGTENEGGDEKSLALLVDHEVTTEDGCDIDDETVSNPKSYSATYPLPTNLDSFKAYKTLHPIAGLSYFFSGASGGDGEGEETLQGGAIDGIPPEPPAAVGGGERKAEEKAEEKGSAGDDGEEAGGVDCMDCSADPRPPPPPPPFANETGEAQPLATRRSGRVRTASKPKDER